MRYYIKQLILILMKWVGIIRLCQFASRNQILILAIHGVMDEQDKPSWKPLRSQLSRNKLEEYLRILSRRYHFVSLIDAVEMLKGHKPIQPYSVVLTFDDGYRNNLTHALPILHRYNAPATFFVCTGFVGNTKPFWFDRLDYVLQHAQVKNHEVKFGSLSLLLDGSSREALKESYKRFRNKTKEQNISDFEFLREIEQISEQLEKESGRALADVQKDDDWSAIMNWDQIMTIGKGDVTIGSHTVDHIRLGQVDTDTVYDQLQRSKRDIEQHTGKSCFSLCYPNGSFTEETIELAKKCGYICGVTTNKKGQNRIGVDLMNLQRINLPNNIRSHELLFRISVTWG